MFHFANFFFFFAIGTKDMALQNLLTKKYTILVLFYSVRFPDIFQVPVGGKTLFFLNLTRRCVFLPGEL